MSRIHGLAVVAAVVLALAGCGKGGHSVVIPDDPAPMPTANPTPISAVGSSDPKSPPPKMPDPTEESSAESDE